MVSKYSATPTVGPLKLDLKLNQMLLVFLIIRDCFEVIRRRTVLTISLLHNGPPSFQSLTLVRIESAAAMPTTTPREQFQMSNLHL
jgi:hypothetical protein